MDCTGCWLPGSSCCSNIYLGNNRHWLPSIEPQRTVFCAWVGGWSRGARNFVFKHRSDVVSERKRSRRLFPLWVQWHLLSSHSTTTHLLGSRESGVGTCWSSLEEVLYLSSTPAPSSAIWGLPPPSVFFMTPRWAFSYPASGPSWISACCVVLKHYGVIRSPLQYVQIELFEHEECGYYCY